MVSRPLVQEFEICSRAFTGATKQMIIELSPIAVEKHLLVGLIEFKVVTPKKKTPEERLLKKAIEKMEEFEGQIVFRI